MDEPSITQFFDRLIPEAFSVPTSAWQADRVDVRPQGDDAFDEWVRERLLDAIHLRHASGVRPWLTIIAESSAGLRWRWYATRGDTSLVLDALRVDLLELADPWLFAFHAPADADDPDPTGDLLDRPAWTLPWYAEARGRGTADVRAGALDLLGDEIVASYPTVTGYGFAGQMHGLLRGHPARRRARLRRRR